MRKAMLVLAALALLVPVVAGCAAPAPATQAPAGTPQVIEKTITATPAPAAKAKRPNVLRQNFGVGDVPTLDPGLAEDTNAITVVEETFVGLTRLDEVTNELHPGMATKWDMSQDGKTYTFTLRTDVPWVKYDGAKKQVVKVQTAPDKDGKTKDRMVTAFDFEYGILRALKKETASPYAYVLDMAIAGAQAYTDGSSTDPKTVGVKALDEKTLEVKFIEPAAYNANIIGLWTAMPVPKWVIEGEQGSEARGDRWIEPGFFQSYGPYTLKEWIHDSSLTMIKNPFWPGDDFTPKAKIDEVQFSMIDVAPAMAEFEAGNLDSTGVPTTDMDRVKADAKLSKLLVMAPNLASEFYGFNTQAPVVNDARVRQAMSMAIDRQALVTNVTKRGEEPAQWISRPGLAGAPTMKDHPDLGVKFDAAKAKQILDGYLKEKNTTADKLDITLMYPTGSTAQRIAEFIQQQWKTNLGLNVKLTNQEWKTFLQTTKGKDTPQVFRMGWSLDYPDANNFTREVFAVGGSQNPAANGVPTGGVNWKNDKFEKLVLDAAREQDPKKRVELYAQVEQILCVDDAAVIPLYWWTRATVTQPWVKRTFSSGGHERYEKWEILQDQ